MSFAAEIYQPRGRGDDVVPSDLDIKGVIAGLREEGAKVTYLGCVAIPGDDMAFYLFDAASRDPIEQALRRLNLTAERIVPAESTCFVSEEPPG